MPLFSPDFLTVFSLLSLSSFMVAWLLWIMGRQYWQQGISQVVLSSILFGGAYAGFAIHSLFNEMTLLILSKLIICLALSIFTLAIQRFRQFFNPIRDLITVSVPLMLSIGLMFIFIPNQLIRYNEFQNIICILQTIYCLRILIQMQSRTPGSGWFLIFGSVGIQFTIFLLLIATKTFSVPHSNQIFQTSQSLILWLVSLMLFIKIFLGGFGFFIMTRDRQFALYKGKQQLDYLTQLPNRLALLDGLKQITSAESETTSPLTIMLVDIDHFQKINEQHGHLLGDQVIQMIAQTLQLQCRATDIAARYGSKEFALLLTNTTIQGAEVLAKRLCEVVRNNEIVLKNGLSLHVTISIGVHCCIPEKNNTWENLFSAANCALNKAKSNGHDNFVISTPSMVQSLK